MTYYIENEFFKAGIKSFGAELTSLVSKKSGHEYMWQGNADIWAGQSPILFPIIGRLINDKYCLDGIEYTMPKHGLFRKREAAMVSQELSKITFIQKNDAETKKIYPYKFKVAVTFELIEKSIKVTHTVFNENDKVMYYSLGAHPAFNCNIGDTLAFESNEDLDTISIDEQSLRVADTIPVLRNNNLITITNDIFNNDALIFSGMKSKYITLISGDKHIKFDYSDCPYLGIWAKPGAPYVCIEPWWGVNDSHEVKHDFSEKDAIQSLAANDSKDFYWQAEISE